MARTETTIPVPGTWPSRDDSQFLIINSIRYEKEYVFNQGMFNAYLKSRHHSVINDTVLYFARLLEDEVDYRCWGNLGFFIAPPP